MKIYAVTKYEVIASIRKYLHIMIPKKCCYVGAHVIFLWEG